MAPEGATTIEGRLVLTGEAGRVRIADGRIAGVEPMPDAGDDLPWIGPGLVDVQVNGYAGIDINEGVISVADLDRFIAALRGVGVTQVLPTVITASGEEIEARMRAMAEAIDADPALAAAIPGFHLEGPFISPEDGARGAHPRDHVIAPDRDAFSRWQEAAGGRIRIVTLSPEWPEAVEFIADCRDAGVVVAIGHTAATPEQVREAVAAGATLSTHLGNGAHPVMPRHPNYVWEQLAADDLHASLIADGFHLPEAVLKVFLRVKGERALLVSDSVALAGMPPGAYTTPVGGEVVLTPEGRLHTASDPRILAGSAQPMLAGIAHLMRSGLADLATAWEMASIRPLALLGEGGAGIAPGANADLVVFRWDGAEIDIETVIARGVPAGPAA